MKKLRLTLDDLQITSFAVEGKQDEAGTVAGLQQESVDLTQCRDECPRLRTDYSECICTAVHRDCPNTVDFCPNTLYCG